MACNSECQRTLLGRRAKVIVKVELNSQLTKHMLMKLSCGCYFCEMNMEEEAKARWGETPAYRQSQERLATYSPEDIEQAAKEMHAATLQVLDAMQRGLPADSDAAIAGAEAHRQAITKWWYDCTFEIHTGLAEMYLADERF